jgi:plastocyanin
MLRPFRVLNLTIAIAALLLSCSNNDNPTMNPPPNSMSVAVKDDFFDPAALTVPSGTTVLWQNQGNSNHTVTSGSANAVTGMFDSPLNNGQTFQFTFTQAGTFPYFCRIHGQMMSGTIVVQ